MAWCRVWATGERGVYRLSIREWRRHLCGRVVFVRAFVAVPFMPLRSPILPLLVEWQVMVELHVSVNCAWVATSHWVIAG